MENSTKTKAQPKSKITTNEDVMQHIIKLGARVDYMIETLQTHADVINEHKQVLARVRSRMGL